MAQSFRLDPIRCDGYGMCAEVLPELIALDDWGYPVIEAGPIPAGLLGHARRAADVCPALALRLRNMESATALPQPAPAAREIAHHGQARRPASHPNEDAAGPRPRAPAIGT